MIYFAIFGILALIGFFDLLDLERKSIILLYSFGFVVIWLLAALRWETGSDWGSYSKFFYFLHSPEPFELGFQIINTIIRSFTNSYTIFLLVFIGICLLIQFYNIKKYTPYILVSLVIFYSTAYYDLFGGIRVALAIAITVYSTRFIVSENKTLFFLFVLLATSFHLSSIIFAFAYLFRKVHFSNWLIVGIILLSLIISQLGLISVLIDLLIKNISSNYRIIYKLAVYSKSDYVIEAQSGILFSLLSIFKRVFIVIIILLYRKKAEAINSNFNLFLNLYIVGIFVYISAMGNIDMLKRLSVFYAIYEIFLISIVVKSVIKYNKIIIYSLILFYAGLRIYTQINTYPDLYMPYKSVFWFDEDITRRIY